MNYKTIFGNVEGDSYYFHQLVESAFPDQKKAYYKHNDTLVVYSEKGATTTFTKEVILLETCEFDINSLLRNKHKMFNLDVNPVRRINGKLVKVPTNDLNDWLERKLKEIGCEMIQSIPMCAYWDKFQQGCKNRVISMYCHQVNGILKIVDEDLFKEKYFNGIGQGKAFGYGLIHFLN